MPNPAYMTIELESQGEVSEGCCSPDSIGSLSKASKVDTVQIQGLEHNINLPTDPQSGQPTGVRVHQGLTVTKVFDKSSPMLYQALCNGERALKVEVQFFRISPTGEEEHYYTITIENATISKIESYMPDCLDPYNAPYTHMERIYFNYKKIGVSHEVAGTAGEDNWSGAE